MASPLCVRSYAARDQSRGTPALCSRDRDRRWAGPAPDAAVPRGLARDGVLSGQRHVFLPRLAGGGSYHTTRGVHERNCENASKRASHTVSHFFSCQEGPREIGRRLYSHDRRMPTNTAVFGGQFVLPSRGARGTRLPWPLLEAVRRCVPAQAQSADARSTQRHPIAGARGCQPGTTT